MSRCLLSVHREEALPLFGFVLASSWLWLTGTSVRVLIRNAALTLTGHLRRRPDPAVEREVRAAFAELDRDLADVLGDRTPVIRGTVPASRQ
ncbi:MAG: hypothetical protein ACRDNS_16915 [Trebonia sp.]